MPKKLKDQQDADRQYDPYSNPVARDLLRQEGEAGQDTGLNSDADSSKKLAKDPENTASNIRATNAAEQSAPDVPNQFNWDNSEKGKSSKKSTRARLRGFARKRGSLFIIGGGFLGAGTLVTMFFSPALLLVQMSEVLNEKFNDQLAALDTRSTLIMKKKLNSQTTKGICGTKLTIKCKYRTISKNQTKRLTAAGLTPMNGQDIIEGRGKPTTFSFNGKEISAGQLLNEARRDPALRSALRKGYNPSFAAWADANAFKLLGRFGIKKSSSVDPSSDKEKMNQQLTDTAKGKVEGVGTTKLQGYNSDGEQVPDGDAKYFESPEGVRYDDADEGRRINTLIQESIDRGGLADGISKSVLKSGVKSVLTSTALGAGAVDTLCTAWTLIRVAGFAAKVYQQRQLIRYSYEFQKQADMIRAGDGKAELSSFFSDIVTKPNKEGKAATDSEGYRWAAYGDVFKPTDFDVTQAKYSEDDAEKQADKIELQNETSRYVNGQLVSTSLMASLANKVSEGGGGVDAADSTCKFVKSWKGQALIIGAALAGAFVAFFSGGTSIGLGAVLNGAAGVTLSVAFALLQPKLIDMAKGEVIKGDENGNEAGNAMVSGAGALNAQASQTRGLPVQTKEDYVAYSELSRQVAADYGEVDRYERGPFDPTSNNTFIGSIVASVIPYLSNSRTVGAGLLNTGAFIGSTTSSVLSPNVNAEETTLQEIDQCDDHEYDKEKLAADPFCNLRYGMSPEDLAIDPEEVVDYMLAGCDGGCIVSDEDPTAKSGSEYENYIKVCIERETSIGDEFTGLSGTGEGGDPGEMCIDGNSGTDEQKHTMFRLMYIDSTVDEGMETDYAVASAAGTGEGIEFTVASYNILHADHHMDDSRRVGGCVANPVPDDHNCAKTRTARQVEIINGGAGNPAFDIVATQETSPQQFNLLKQSLSNYDAFPNDGSRLSNNQDGAVAILWNRQKFTKFAEGKMPAISNTSLPITNPWVGLQAPGGQKVYITSIHYAVSGYGGTAESIKKSSVLTTDWVKDKVSDGSTVIVAGDFNDRPSQKISYCVYTQNGLMAHAQNIKDGKMSDPDCNNLPSYDGIDHIYATPNNDLSASAWQHMPEEGIVAQSSDHSPSYATFAFPGAPAAGGTEPVPYKNSVYNKSAPDPSVIRGDDGVYHVYATGGSNDNPFIHLSSTDLVNWKPAGRTLNNPPSWVKSGLHWAPDVTKVGSQYILSFTGGTDSSRKIGYAVSTSAAGPFNYKGMLVEPGEFPRPDGRGTIDSHIFVDGGQPYLFYGGGIISVTKLSISADGTITKNKSSRKELISRNSTGTVEGAWVHKRGNYYYLFYSFGDYNQRSGAAEYSTRIARSTSVMGPYEPATPYKALLQGKDPFRGPGHNSVATDNAGNDWIVYHALNGRNDRVLMIDPITYSGDGWPMVNDGHPSSQKITAGPALGGSGGGSVAAGGVAWPIDKKWFETNRADILNAHGGAGTFTSPGTDGIAADIGLPGGTPIYALAGGTITKKPLGRSSRICAGVPNGNDNGGLQISSDIQGGKLEVAYAHGTNVVAGPTVTAGQKIMDAGQVGNSCGVHLHIDMSFNGKNLCPQDVFLALSRNQTPNFAELANKAGGSCGR